MPDTVFPENQIQILDDFISTDLINGMRGALAAAIVDIDGEVIQPDDNSIEKTVLARRQLASFLKFAVSQPASPSALEQLQALNQMLARRNFAGAEPSLAGLVQAFGQVPPPSPLPDLRVALSSQSRTFIELVERPNKPPRRVTRQLPGYSGPRPDEGPGERLKGWRTVLADRAEQHFMTGLLRAEVDAGLRHFEDAIRDYDRLLAAAPTGSPRCKFLALRSAFARLALGDQMFRRQRALSDGDRQAITAVYDGAIGLLEQNGVSPDNPQRQQIEAHAARQKALLAANLNVLGLWDAFVPVQRFTVLEQDAKSQIDGAIASVQAFTAFLGAAEAEQEKQMDMAFQQQEESLNLAVQRKKQRNAMLAVDKIDEQIAAIEQQQDFFSLEPGSMTPSVLAGAAQAIISGVAASKEPGSPPLGLATGSVGVAGVLVSLLDQREQLANQGRLAQIDKQIAENEVAIAALERRISEQRLQFLGQKLAFLQGKRLNSDLLFALALANEQRAEEQVNAAVALLYLFERALAFFLGEPEIRQIQFDYLDRPLGIFDAAGALLRDFERVKEARNSVEQEELDAFEEIVSLRETYPLQFGRFLQSGQMEFVYSLYQLSKRRPASHQCRLREVGVELIGLVPPTGFSGALTHMGRFTVREKPATLAPAVTRLVPTDEQLAEALDRQRREGSAVAAVGGVLFYDLEPDTKELNINTQFVSQLPPGQQATLDLFEGHGPTGLWRLKIRDHERLAISDILLHFGIISRKSDPFALEPKVEALIGTFEAEMAAGDRLDRFSAFSLRQSFLDTYLALENGPAALVLAERNFPPGLMDLRFKTVVAQALDSDGKPLAGIGLEIARPDVAFSRSRVTRVDGFSEDLDSLPPVLPPAERFPVIGTWRVELADPAQFARLGDLRLFFLYAFTEQ